MSIPREQNKRAAQPITAGKPIKEDTAAELCSTLVVKYIRESFGRNASDDHFTSSPK